MAYNGYKLLDKISLVCREPSKNEEYYQAYLVDPSNKKQVEAVLSPVFCFIQVFVLTFPDW